MPEQKDTISAILGASAALAGLLLVFMGFVYARGESYQSAYGDKFKIAAKAGLIPFVAALACTGASTEWMIGHRGLYLLCVRTFQATLFLTGGYGTVVTIFFL